MKTDNSNTTSFEIGDKVRDLSGCIGTVIENPSDNYFIRVDFQKSGWRDLKSEQLTKVTESLEDFAEYEASVFYNKDNVSIWHTSDATQWKRRKENIILGANWQKEQYKDLIQSHSELLAILEICKYSFSSQISKERAKLYPKGLAARVFNGIEKANKVINSLP